MIVDVEKLRKARLAVGTVWTTMSNDNALADDIHYVNTLLLNILLDLDEGGESIIELKSKPPSDIEMMEKGEF